MMRDGLKHLLWLLLALIPVASFGPRLRCIRSGTSASRASSYPRLDRALRPPHATAAAAAGTHEVDIRDIPHNRHQRNIVVLSHNVSQDVADGIFDANNLLKGRLDVLSRCVSSSLWVSNGIRDDTNVFLMLFPHNVTIEIRGANVRSLTPDERTTSLCLQRALWTDEEGRRLREEREGRRDREDYGGDVSSSKDNRRNNNNPRSVPMSEEKTLRDARKGREAMVGRIRRTNEGKKGPPPGFVLHRDDTLRGRLERLSSQAAAMSSASSVGGGGDDDESCHDVWMMSETGEPLWDVLMPRNATNGERAERSRTTTLILGNQLGYSTDDEELLSSAADDAPYTVRQVSLGPLSLLTSQCITIAHHYLDRANSLV